MASIAIQRGHCWRTSGSTGTIREQPAVDAIGKLATKLLRERGHRVYLLLADAGVPRTDLFVALHCDGSSSSRASGASVGYRNSSSRTAAHLWKQAYQRRGWSHGFRGDNYTTALSRYYGTGRAHRAGTPRAFIVEHGFMTNLTERQFIESPRGRTIAAMAIVDTVGALYGHPNPNVGEPGISPRILKRTDPMMRGEDVKDWQIDLRKWQQRADRQPEITVDGWFGDETDLWTKRFQRSERIVDDGDVGPNTLKAMERVLDRPKPPEENTVAFDDVPEDHALAKDIVWAKEMGLIQGRPDGTFHPDDALTRAQACTLMRRLRANLMTEVKALEITRGEGEG